MRLIRKEYVEDFSMGGRLNLCSLPTLLDPSKLYTINGVTTQEDFTFQISSRNILIYPNNTRGYRLSATLTNSNELDWRLYTKQPFERKPNPDMHASMFYHTAMEYLVNTMGNDIEAIIAEWNGGTNFNQYRESIKQKKSVETACFSTWSGRKALEYGFNRCVPLTQTDLNQAKYKFLFKK